MTPCWHYNGRHRAYDGRPVVWIDGRDYYVYRLVYEEIFGPTDLLLHHRCEHVWCVNPYHLEPVTMAAHLLIHDLGGDHGQMASKTRCPAGHPYDADNTYRVPSTGERRCRTCTRATKKRYHNRLRAGARQEASER